MSERHKRKNARELLSKAGYKSGGHFGGKMIGESVREGVHEHESNMHPGKKHTKLKLKDGGSVQHAAFGARIHKPRGHKGKKPHTQVNVVVGAPKPPMPIPVPAPNLGAPTPPGGMPGTPPTGPMPGMKRGGRFCDGGSIKAKESERAPIKSTAGKVEGKLKKGGKVQKFDFGGPVNMNGPGAIPNMANAGNIMRMNPNAGPGMVGGGPNPGTVMQMNPNGPSTSGGGMLTNNPVIQGGGGGKFAGPCSQGLYKKGGRAKTADPDMDSGAGGGLGRLEKAKAYGAPVKKGGRA